MKVVYKFLENSPRKIRMLIGVSGTSCCHNDVASKENIPFDDQSKQFVSFFVITFFKRKPKQFI